MKLKTFIFFALAIVNINAKKNFSSINELTNIEVAKARSVPNIMLFFKEPVYCERHFEKDKVVLELSFPGMNISSFEKNKVISKIKELKELVKDVYLQNRTVPCPRAIIGIVFKTQDMIFQWYKLDEDKRLIFNFYSKKLINQLKMLGDRLVNAKNDLNNLKPEALKNGSIPKGFINLGSPNFKNNINSKKIRIVVDAGHGGEDCGASSKDGLREKDIALDLARKTQKLLLSKGFSVFVTRNSDKNLSLLERNELASQLKADLLVSIHVNAAPTESLSGIETYYCLLPKDKIGGFLFFFETENSNQKDEYIKLIDNFVYQNINLSKKLAFNIQDSLICFLNKNNINIDSKGVKQSIFRILLRSEIPVVLVEVGFLTNKREADLLKNDNYRQMLARGISKGIKNYIYS